MGTVLTLIDHHPIISSLGIMLTFVAAWGTGYLRGHRHGEEREAEYQQNRQEALLKSHSQQAERILAESDIWRKRALRLEDRLINEAHLRNIPPRIITPGSKEPPTPINDKEIG